MADIEAIKREADQLDTEGDVQKAEKRFREALAGFENILSPTHEDTNAAAYRLATFYVNHDRMNDADLVLNWMGEKHVERWGVDHEKTMTHLLYVADLFNSWSRSDEAVIFLYRVLDTWDKQFSIDVRQSTSLNPRLPRFTQPKGVTPRRTAQQPELEDISRTFAETDDPVRVDYQLGLANARLTSGDGAAESILLRLIEQCERHPERLNSQILQARCTLVDLYRRLEDNENMANALGQAQKSLERILESTAKKSERLLKACTKVARLHLKSSNCEVAEDIFQRIGGEAEDTLGIDHEATITILIDVGQIYQHENMWTSAQPWFERALAASMTANGLRNMLTKRLEAALENQNYSTSGFAHEEETTFSLHQIKSIKFVV